MPKFRVTETRPATMVWEYIVEAETQEEAITIVEDGGVEPIDHSSDYLSDFSVRSHYEAEEEFDGFVPEPFATPEEVEKYSLDQSKQP
jgi:hypothetical protein